MPRIATIPPPEVPAARAQLRAYLAHEGHSEMELSRISGIPQYTISRFLTGRIKSLTPDVKAFLIYANIGIEQNAEKLCNEPLIQQALGNAWDGTAEGMTRIAMTINALAPILRSSQTKA